MLKRLRKPDPNHDLTRRTAAENLWLWRHRQDSRLGPARGRRGGSMSQSEAAEIIGVSSTQYVKLENDETTLMSLDDITRLRSWPLLQHPVNPTVAELCFLARRRSGRPVAEIARELKTTTTSFGKWEADGDLRLRAYWTRQGFKFPPLKLSRPTASVPEPDHTQLPPLRDTRPEGRRARATTRAGKPPSGLRKRTQRAPAPPQMMLSRPTA